MYAFLQSSKLLAGILLVGMMFSACSRQGQLPEPVLDAAEVAAALQALDGGKIFVAVDSLDWFTGQGFTGWSVPIDQHQARRAGLEAEYWRQLDREQRFDAVGFFGTAAESLSLLDHLVKSSDWNPVWVGSSGCLFQRRADPNAWQLSGAKASASQVRWLLNLGKLQAAAAQIGKLDQELDAGEKNALQALLAAEYGEWGKVVQLTSTVGTRDGETARLRARALIEQGRGRDAWHLTRELVRGRSVDGPLLFLHARAARAAKAWQAEIEALEKLVSLVESKQAPSARYKVYLAQAHASAGHGEQALVLFRELAQDQSLPPAQRQFVVTALERLEQQLE